ncbi:hypothetical protein ACTXT7_010224 [Hymenolepis weldensis]
MCDEIRKSNLQHFIIQLTLKHPPKLAACMQICVEIQKAGIQVTADETKPANKPGLTKSDSSERIKPEESVAEPTKDAIDPAERPDETRQDELANEKYPDESEENTAGNAATVEQQESLEESKEGDCEKNQESTITEQSKEPEEPKESIDETAADKALEEKPTDQTVEGTTDDTSESEPKESAESLQPSEHPGVENPEKSTEENIPDNIESEEKEPLKPDEADVTGETKEPIEEPVVESESDDITTINTSDEVEAAEQPREQEVITDELKAVEKSKYQAPTKEPTAEEVKPAELHKEPTAEQPEKSDEVKPGEIPKGDDSITATERPEVASGGPVKPDIDFIRRYILNLLRIIEVLKIKEELKENSADEVANSAKPAKEPAEEPADETVSKPEEIAQPAKPPIDEVATATTEEEAENSADEAINKRAEPEPAKLSEEEQPEKNQLLKVLLNHETIIWLQNKVIDLVSKHKYQYQETLEKEILEHNDLEYNDMINNLTKTGDKVCQKHRSRTEHDPPKNLKLTQVEDNKVRMTWEMPTHTGVNVTGYLLYYNDHISSWKKVKTTEREVVLPFTDVLTVTVSALYNVDGLPFQGNYSEHEHCKVTFSTTPDRVFSIKSASLMFKVRKEEGTRVTQLLHLETDTSLARDEGAVDHEVPSESGAGVDEESGKVTGNSQFAHHPSKIIGEGNKVVESSEVEPHTEAPTNQTSQPTDATDTIQITDSVKMWTLIAGVLGGIVLIVIVMCIMLSISKRSFKRSRTIYHSAPLKQRTFCISPLCILILNADQDAPFDQPS